MIEYRFVAPAQSDGAIRAALEATGVQGVTAKPVVDNDLILAEIRANHQQFVDNLFAPKDEKTQPKVDKAFEGFLADVTAGSYQPTPELSLAKFKEVVKDVFLECVRVEPFNISIDPHHTRWSSPVLRPTRVRALAYRYSLDGADKRSLKEVAAALGRKNITGLSDYFWKDISQINLRLRNKELLTLVSEETQATSA